MTDAPACQDLETYVNQVRSLVDRDLPAEETAVQVGALNDRLFEVGFRMPEEFCNSDPSAPYTRNLIHQDEQNRFSVIAIVWGPHQETNVHDHLNWCVMSVFEHACVATDYQRMDDRTDPDRATLAVRKTTLAEVGSVVVLTPPPSTNIHKIANASNECAITLHTYGDPGTKARVFDLDTGRVELRDLDFHNVG